MVRVVPRDVAERVCDFAPAAQDVRVVAVGEDRTVTSHESVEPFRQPDGESLYPAREGAPILGLDDQMEVYSLHGIVDDPQPEPLFCLAENALDGAHPAVRT